MQKPELIVIGASAGGLEGLLEIAKQLPERLSAAILVVVHTQSDGDSFLPQILSRASQRGVRFAEHHEPITPGSFLVAPRDVHMLVEQRRIVLNRGPRENGFRPAVDPLFRTAARAYGSRLMGIVLSGALDDGAYGMSVIKNAGGITVVQHPDEAAVPSMPLSVMKAIDVDHVLPVADIGKLIIGIDTESRTIEGEPGMAAPNDPEPQDLADEMKVKDMLETYGPPSGLTCPDCGGALWEIKDHKLVRYRCHVGHQFSPDGLNAQQGDVVEGALWGAVRVLEEHTEMRLRMADRAQARGLDLVSDGFKKSARETHEQAHAIRALLFGRNAPAPPSDAPNNPGGAITLTAGVKAIKANGRGRGRGTRRGVSKTRRS